MLEIDVKGPTIMLGDKNLVIKSRSLPSSTLNKKHYSIAYHKVHESVAARIIILGYVRSENNQADILTKALGTAIFYK